MTPATPLPRYFLFACAILLLCFPAPVSAQMVAGTDTLYGNEWIDYSKTYFKIKVAEDGIYRIDQSVLAAAGLPLNSIPAAEFRLYINGQQAPLFTSTNGIFAPGDYLEFFGEKNRDALDRFLFSDPGQENLNPWNSLVNDTATYFLSWSGSGLPERYALAVNDLSNAPPKETFCYYTSGLAYLNRHLKRRESTEITYSWFNGEGFGRSYADLTNLSLPTKKYYASGPPAKVTLRYACDLGVHEQRVSVNDSLLATDVFSGWKVVQHELLLPAGSLSNSTKLKVESATPELDRHTVAGASIRYSRQFNFENAAMARFELDPSSQSKYLEVTAFDLSGGAPPVLYDLSNRLRLEGIVQGNLLKFQIPPSPTTRQLLLFNPATALHAVAQLQPAPFHDYTPEAGDFILLSHPALFHDPLAGGANHVAEYADYRRSAAGGNHTVTVVDVEELYDQFAYGTRFHPIAVRNFCHWAKKHWPDPQNLFIIGKGLDYNDFRDPATQSALADSLFFVPTYGTPGADLLFAMGNGVSEPIFPVGRLAVTRPQEIAAYLEKVKAHEQQVALAPQTLAGKAWMKRAIHISGGLGNEQPLIKGYVQQLTNALETNRFGADVHTFYKTSNDPVQQSAYEQIRTLVDDGVAVWSIFGHSSTNAIDFDIGAPDAYANHDRYPFMLVMGCFSGLCSAPQQGLGEQFVLAPQRGAIAWVASVNYSTIGALAQFGNQCYAQLGGADYHNSIGAMLQHTVKALQGATDPGLLAVLHQNLLQGDPAVQVHTQPGPDYIIDPQSVAFTPNPIGLEYGSFNIKLDLVNLGENVPGKTALRIEQRRPDQTTLPRLTDTLDAPAWRQSLTYDLPTAGSQIGFNRFLITADAQDQIDEKPAAAEMNNTLLDAGGQPGAEVYFYAEDVMPLAPPPYGIVPQQQVLLHASTLNTNALPLRYLFEFDTAATFDSPFKKTFQTMQRGGLIEWQPPVNLVDSTVYYWRVARDSLVNGAVVWRNSSFLALTGSGPGWSQSHFGQFVDGQFTSLALPDSTRQFAFLDNAGFVAVHVAFRGQNRYPGLQNAFYEGNTGDFFWNGEGIQSGVVLMRQDPASGHVILNPPGSPWNAGTTAKFYFGFQTQDVAQRQALMDFLDNEIKPGEYVGLLAFNRATDTLGYAPKAWAMDSLVFGKNLFQTLENLGANRIRQTAGYAVAPPAYGFIFQKGNPAFGSVDTVLTAPDSAVVLRKNFNAKWSAGKLETPVIGPARQWGSLHWRRGPHDNPSDESKLEVLGVRAGQADTLLAAFPTAFDTALNFLSAAQWPLLRLRYQTSDTLLRTATQLQWARVLYTPVPEGALHPSAQLIFQRDTLQQGEPGKISVAFANVSAAGFDSLSVKFKIENQGLAAWEAIRKYRTLPPDDTLHAALQFPTIQLDGAQRLLVEVNPAPGEQPEQYHFNNVLVQDFFVRRDDRNPLLDVTFDGMHVLDGDIVSPRPEIQISLRDDNRFLALSDTGLFALSLSYPNGLVLPINSNEVQFFPASGNLAQQNRARLLWHPDFTIDGEYQLRAQGHDVSGNASAALDYVVRFRVITRSSLSNILPYPNPFSTSTCFVYTMTGAETPADFRLQIMTVSGRVVREVTAAEFGPLHAGVHQSEFCWDGRDQYGDQLANGVYLYRVTAKKSDGKAFEFFEREGVDGFFKGGVGKVVLMR